MQKHRYTQAEYLATPNRKILWANRELDFNSKTYVMGVLNCTPDSFYPASRLKDSITAMAEAREMIHAGADILDIGGESTRPGSESVSTEEEIRRVLPVIEEIRKKSDVFISIDTQKFEVAVRALDAGADIVNDISGLRNNVPLTELIASRRVPVILMHMRGTPKTMQENPEYSDTVGEIFEELKSSINFAVSSGIRRDSIIVDPGVGFGKRMEDNLRIIKHLRSFRALGPVLIGLSRKSFIGEILDAPVEKRLAGTIAANTYAIINGADIVRVHDVSEAVDMVKMIDFIYTVK